MNKNQKRMLVVCKESAGDMFILSGVIDSLKKKFPDFHIYVATSPQFFNIIEGNPNVKGTIEYGDFMQNYRSLLKWASFDNLFDIVYFPSIQTQVVPYNWLNSEYAIYLGQFYANACNVQFGEQFIKLVDTSKFNLPKEYITIQNQSGQEPKNYDFFQKVVDRLQNIQVVQLGATKDKKLENVVDLRGKTSFQEAASIIKGAKLHIGLDSVLMHFAGWVQTPSVIIFGGTLHQAGVNPEHKHNIHIIEPSSRGLCVSSCHLIECYQEKEHRHQKCISNIAPGQVLAKIKELIGASYIKEEEPIKLSAYLIIKDGIKYGFPFEESIKAAVKVSDEVVVVDGGSKDGTWAKLYNIARGKVIREHPETQDGDVTEPTKIKIFQHPWDLDNPSLFGDEKTYARQKCTGDWLIQLDADEIIQEPYPGAIKDIIQKNHFVDVIDLPCINFYGDDETIRIETGHKWRISKNHPNIIHGVHGDARKFDTETMKVVFDKKISDSCEYIYADNLQMCRHLAPLECVKYLFLNEFIKHDKSKIQAYLEELEKVSKVCPVAYHYSWADLNRKLKNGEFWDETFHGKQNATHNTSSDIAQRIEARQDFLLKVNINHPLKKENKACVEPARG